GAVLAADAAGAAWRAGVADRDLAEAVDAGEELAVGAALAGVAGTALATEVAARVAQLLRVLGDVAASEEQGEEREGSQEISHRVLFHRSWRRERPSSKRSCDSLVAGMRSRRPPNR